MTLSIINAFKSNSSLSFSLLSSTPLSTSHKAENALNKNGYWFESIVSDAFWQISFSRPVSIGSYIISGPSNWIYSPTSWEISFLLDGSTFISKQIDKIDDLRGNTKKFAIKPPIYCKSFKITGKSTGNKDHPTSLWFYGFDCFGPLKENTLCKNYVMNQFLMNLLIMLMIPFSLS